MLDKSIVYNIFIIVVFQRKQILRVCYIRIVVIYSKINKLNCNNIYTKYILKYQTYTINLLINLEVYTTIIQIIRKNKNEKRNNCILILQNTLET